MDWYTYMYACMNIDAATLLQNMTQCAIILMINVPFRSILANATTLMAWEAPKAEGHAIMAQERKKTISCHAAPPGDVQKILIYKKSMIQLTICHNYY